MVFHLFRTTPVSVTSLSYQPRITQRQHRGCSQDSVPPRILYDPTSTHLLCSHGRALHGPKMLVYRHLFIYLFRACMHFQWCAAATSYTLICASCNAYTLIKTNPEQRKSRPHQHTHHKYSLSSFDMIILEQKIRR